MSDLSNSLGDFVAWLQGHSLVLDQRQEDLFRRLLGQYGQWLPKLNFTSIKEPREFVVKHLVDSLAPLKLVSWEGVANLLDVGSGGGFPGIPLGIMLPQLSVALLEATGKKVAMLQAIVKQLALGNVRVAQGRAEECGHGAEMREQFDLVAARALGEWPVMLELTLPFARVGGRLLAYQGPGIKDELVKYEERLVTLGGKIEKLHPYALPFDMGDHVIVEVRKIKETPSEYPRRLAAIKRGK